MTKQYRILDLILDMMLSQKERVMTMFTFKNVQGHVQVYDRYGKFLFSADSEREAREELCDYEECAA